jgi:GNAT superfamily N-acetyltransferase
MSQIRLARAADKDDVVRLWMDLLRSQGEIDERYAPADDAEVRWRNDFDEWLDRDSRRLFVAVVDDQVRGFITAERSAPPPIFRLSSEVYVNELFVEPDSRRSGIGSSLISAVKKWAEELGAERIRAGVLASNEDGGAFWAASGGEVMSVTFGIDLGRAKGAGDEHDSERARIGF